MVAGEVVVLSPLVRRILAPNPSMMTGPGTNTYLVGPTGGDLAAIDPGPDDDVHLDVIAAAAAAEGGRIRWIVVTHTHSDHAPGAAGLKTRTGAEVVGYEPRPELDPDRHASDGDVVGGADAGFTLRAIHTPGHASDHLCWLLEEEWLLFSGDHVMSGSTVVVAPPDGDMAAYLQGIQRLQAMDPPVAAIAPGHGPLIADPAGVLRTYLAHRTAREEAIHAALAAAGTATVDDVVTAVYVDVPDTLHPVARYSVWAHLRKLAGEGRVAGDDVDDVGTVWRATTATATTAG